MSTFFVNGIICIPQAIQRDMGMACSEIASTNDTLQKNHIFVESLGSVFGGSAFGIATTITLAVMATPVGWLAALVIGAGSFAASVGGRQVVS